MSYDTGWFKSSRSAGSNNACVEVRLTADEVGVRDSKNAAGPRLGLPSSAWGAFVAGLKR